MSLAVNKIGRVFLAVEPQHARSQRPVLRHELLDGEVTGRPDGGVQLRGRLGRLMREIHQAALGFGLLLFEDAGQPLLYEVCKSHGTP
jgi:hypothetical protein